MGTYAPMTESLREMNRLLMESRQWDAQQKQSEQQFGLQQMQIESQMKTQQQMQQINQAKVMQAQEDMKPQTLNAFNFLTNDETTRRMLFEINGGAFGNELAGTLEPGAKLKADGNFYRADGEPLQLNKMQMDRVMPGLFAIATKYDDPVFELENQSAGVNKQIDALDKEISLMPGTDPRMQPKRAALLAQRNKLKSQASNYMEQTAPEQILEKLRQNYRNLQQFAVGAASQGNNPQLNNVISNAASHLNGRIKSIEDNLMAEKLADIKSGKEGKSGQLELAFIMDANDNIIGSKYIPVSKSGAGKTPHEADPTLDTKQKVVWAPQVEKAVAKGKAANDAAEVRRKAIKNNFYDQTGFVIRGDIDIMKERIAQIEHEELMRKGAFLTDKEGNAKTMNEIEMINHSVKYPEKALTEFDNLTKLLVKHRSEKPDFATLPPEVQQAEIVKIQTGMNGRWETKYGFSIDQYRKMYKEAREDMMSQ